MSYNSYLQVITLKLCFHETDVDADAGVGGKKNRSNVFPLEPFPRGRRLRRHVPRPIRKNVGACPRGIAQSFLGIPLVSHYIVVRKVYSGTTVLESLVVNWQLYHCVQHL